MLAPTLAGHAGGPPLGPGRPGAAALADAVERAMDEAGFETAELAGNSLGAYLALRLAERGRARSVVALAPAGGWPAGDRSRGQTFAAQAELLAQMRQLAPRAHELLETTEGRRRATGALVVNFEHIPAELIAHQMLSVAAAPAAARLLESAQGEDWALAPERIGCPLRVVWGTADALLPWPTAAVRYRHELLPHADWVVLEGIGHCPQLDVPLETAELILGIGGS